MKNSTPNKPNPKKSKSMTSNQKSLDSDGSVSLLARLRQQDPFKPMYPVKLRYAYNFQLASAAGFALLFGTEQVFRLNSLFDPDLTNVGHQPYGFDQLKLMYGSYRVRACHVDIEFFGSNTDDLVCAFTVQSGQNTTALGGSALDAAHERQSVLTRPLPINGQNRWRHRESFPIHAIAGLPRTVTDNDDAYQALVGANPASQCYLRIAVATQVNVTKACQCSVLLTYDAVMFDRISMAQS